MKIEPCICHFEYPEQYTVDANCLYIYCPRCGSRGAFGATVEKAIQEWNRPARIVRAAERLIRAREALVEAFAQMDMDYPHFSVSQKADELTRDVDDANRELTKAVNGKGGAE